MTEPDCKLYRDERWTCEEHPDQPWGHGGYKGAGVPRPACNPAGGPDEPPTPPWGFMTPSTGSTADVSKKSPPSHWRGFRRRLHAGYAERAPRQIL